MDWYRIFGICGVIGAFLCILGDLLLDLKGPDNKKLGKYGIMDSAWDHMDVKRFVHSILLAGLGAPLASLGFTAMAHELAKANEGFGIAYFIIAILGAGGGFFIHAFICLLPVLYKKIEPDHGFDYAESIINTAYEAVKIPFWCLYMALVAVPSLMVIFALWNGYLDLSRWFILLTPPCLMVFGGVLQKINNRIFCDLPMVITPSLGLAMMSLMAVLNM